MFHRYAYKVAPKIIPLFAGITLLAAACGSSTTHTSSSASSGSGRSHKHYTIAYVPGATGVAFYDTLRDGMEAKAASLGMSVIYQGSPTFSPSAQTPVVDAVCTRHPNVLVLSPTDPTALEPAVQQCLAAGIPVITVDTTLATASQLTSAITTNNTQGGTLAADFVGKALHGSGQVAVLSLSPTASTQVERVEAFEKALAASYPGIHVVTTQYTAQPVTSSESIVRSILLAHPQIKAIFGAAEPNAEGAADAIAADGKTGQIVNVGFDAGPSEVALLKQGRISAVVAQQAAEEGSLAAQYAYDKLTGHTSAIKRSVELDDVLITSTDANDPAYQKYFYKP